MGSHTIGLCAQERRYALSKRVELERSGRGVRIRSGDAMRQPLGASISTQGEPTSKTHTRHRNHGPVYPSSCWRRMGNKKTTRQAPGMGGGAHKKKTGFQNRRGGQRGGRSRGPAVGRSARALERAAHGRCVGRATEGAGERRGAEGSDGVGGRMDGGTDEQEAG